MPVVALLQDRAVPTKKCLTPNALWCDCSRAGQGLAFMMAGKKFFDVDDGDWKFIRLTANPSSLEPVRGALDGFMCPITLNVMWDPHQVDCPGGHVFDRADLEEHMKRSQACPTCRAPIRSCQPIMHLRRLILETVVVKCPHCQEEMAAGAILEHINDRCREVT
jgi:hypothetical protein